MFGMTVEEASGSPVEVWPDNSEPLTVFIAMDTQWRTGFAGRTGLDYGALPEVWRRTKVPHSRRDQVFADLQLMEAAALELFHRK